MKQLQRQLQRQPHYHFLWRTIQQQQQQQQQQYRHQQQRRWLKPVIVTPSKSNNILQQPFVLGLPGNKNRWRYWKQQQQEQEQQSWDTLSSLTVLLTATAAAASTALFGSYYYYNNRQSDNDNKRKDNQNQYISSTTTTTTTTTRYGNVGRYALQTLQQQCPTARIAVIDPFIITSSSSSSSLSTSTSTSTTTTKEQDNAPKKSKYNHNNQHNTVDFIPLSRVTELDPINKECTVTIEGSYDESIPSSSSTSYTLSYRHAILIATGCRGAPPPTYLIDTKAQSHIYEYRPTIVPSQQQQQLQQENDHSDPITATATSSTTRPIVSQEQVRKLVQQHATNGSTIAVLGSGWDAIDLIMTANTNNSSNGKRTTTTTKEPNVLVYGSYGPVSHIVPNYLSAEIARKIQTKRVTILDRSLIRYISYVGDRKVKTPSQSQQQSPLPKQIQQQLQVYTAKSYDFLDGKAIPADYVVIAPDVYNSRGTGAFPTSHIPSFLQNDLHNHTSWYHTWSSLTMIDENDDDMDDLTTLLSCYKDDGRIAVNNELLACTGVYAAGSVAKYPNNRSGHATVAGIGIVDGMNAGYVAAMNMSKLYEQQQQQQHRIQIPKRQSVHSNYTTTPYPVFMKDPIPIWRSDIRSTVTTTFNTNDQKVHHEQLQQRSSLEELGIVALCVGNCDSENLATHGVWWTNTAAYRRLLVMAEMNGDTINDTKMKKSFKPIYGFGVVYYLDSNNKIQGVMTWGIPFYRSEHNRQLNEVLIQQIKEVLTTNGGFRTLDNELDRIQFSQYLQKVSKEMLVGVFSNHESSNMGTNHQLDRTIERLPRPLHRYTEVRPPNVRMVGLFKQNLGMLGQDLFTRFEQDDTPDKPIPLPLEANLGSAVAKVQAKYDWDVWEQIEKRWDENEYRARPSKEDPLWIRKGDEGRAMAHRDRLAEAYSKAFSGKK